MAYRVAALVIGLVLTAYWGRVMRLVYKVRKQTGKSANLRPKEGVGMGLRVLWYPAVVAWICAGVAISCLAATWVCWKRMGKEWRMGINPEEKTQLIVSGPYAYVRHPIYALSSVLMVASVVAIPSPLMLGVGVIHLALLQWEARREEKYLVVHHGEAYAEYCRRVGRFVPRWGKPYRPAA